jgi:hypothetical protein
MQGCTGAAISKPSIAKARHGLRHVASSSDRTPPTWLQLTAPSVLCPIKRMVGRIIRASIATYIVLPDNRRLTDFQIMPEKGACNTVKAILTQLSMSMQLVFALSYLRDTCPIELEFDLISF